MAGTGLDTADDRSLKPMLYGIAGGTLLIIVVAGVMYGSARDVMAAAFPLMLGLLWLIHRNWLLIPRIAMPLVTFAIAVYQVITNDGVRDEAMFAFPVVIVLGGLLLGRIGIVMMSLLTILATSGVVYAEINGILVTQYSENTALSHMIFLDVLLGFTSMLLYFTINNLTDSLKRLRQNEAVLSESNRALESIRLGLEGQIVERTHNLEIARQDTEAANRALQAQMWQLSGLAQLSDAMRGEQDLPTLSTHVIQHLCRYVDAAVGALYVLNDDILRQTGSYAYTLSPKNPVAFKLGEALVGQVARDQCLLQLDAVPADYLRVASGLGETAPRHLVILPFLFEGCVVGVVEVGSLTRLTPAQLDFLQAAMQNIAIAFNTAQARARINTLLIAASSPPSDF